MKYIHQNFLSHKIIQYVKDLILDYDYKSYDDLSDSDKAEFVILLIEASGKSSEYECLVECQDLDKTITFLKNLLSNPSEENIKIFSETVRENAIKYYEETMEEIFNQINQNYNSFYENDYYSNSYANL